MGLDICRFIEVKRNGKWERIICGKEYSLLCKRNNMIQSHYGQEKLDEITEKMNCNAVAFNNGKAIAEYWLEDSSDFKSGLPDDTDWKELYHQWGYSQQYITADRLCSLINHYTVELHGSLKGSLTSLAKSIWGRFKKKTEEFYPEYPWDDHKIEDKFDDEYYLGIWKLQMLMEDYHYAKAITEICYPDDFILDKDIRIIYIYNR